MNNFYITESVICHFRINQLALKGKEKKKDKTFI